MGKERASSGGGLVVVEGGVCGLRTGGGGQGGDPAYLRGFFEGGAGRLRYVGGVTVG